MSLRQILGKIGLWISVFVIVSPAILFFLWMLSLSFKNELDNTAFPPVFIPSHPTWANFIDVFEKNDFVTLYWEDFDLFGRTWFSYPSIGGYLYNSVVVSFTATGLALLVGVPAGFGVAKTKAHKMAALIMIARVTPGLSYLVPLFLLFQWIGMIGSLTPLIITHLVITVPIVVWVMIGFFEGLPNELEEAALVDGATIWQAFRYIALPLARPGIVVALILAFLREDFNPPQDMLRRSRDLLLVFRRKHSDEGVKKLSQIGCHTKRIVAALGLNLLKD